MSLPQNQGAAALLVADTIAGTVAKVHCSSRNVSRWRSSQQLPGADAMAAMQKAYGISPQLWGRKVEQRTPYVPVGPSDASSASPPPSAGTTPEDTAERRLRSQIERLATMRSDPLLTDRARVDIERLELGASRELARLKGELGITAAMIMRCPYWDRIEERITEALTPWPEARRCVADAISELDHAS
jgi:hypothetical protein